MIGTASIMRNVFKGDKPHELTVVVEGLDDGTTAPLGRFRRFAVESYAEAKSKCEELGIAIRHWYWE